MKKNDINLKLIVEDDKKKKSLIGSIISLVTLGYFGSGISNNVNAAMTVPAPAPIGPAPIAPGPAPGPAPAPAPIAPAPLPPVAPPVSS